MTENTTAETGHRATRTPFADQRYQTILSRLQAHGSVDVGEMATDLGVTNETVRKDLILLEKQGLLRRVHGGAPDPPGRSTYEPADCPSNTARPACPGFDSISGPRVSRI